MAPELVEQEMIDQDWEKARRWFSVTHQEDYDRTVHAGASGRLDILMMGMIDPERLKSEEGYKGLDPDRARERAAGEIAAWQAVLSWKDTAAECWRVLQEQRAEEEAEPEDVDPKSPDQWHDHRE